LLVGVMGGGGAKERQVLTGILFSPLLVSGADDLKIRPNRKLPNQVREI